MAIDAVNEMHEGAYYRHFIGLEVSDHMPLNVFGHLLVFVA